MARKKGEVIQEKALELLRQHPEGLRYAEWHRKLAEALPEMEVNTIHGNLHALTTTRTAEIEKPSRGLYRAKSSGALAPPSAPPAATTLSEQDFYEPFAQYLKNDLEECTEAVALGGSSLGGKWGTPDVVGVLRAARTDLIKFPEEVIAAEVKLNAGDPVTAFGQAVAYRLFASKSFLVLPDSIAKEDADRVEALCMANGVGLILYVTDSAEPKFSIRVRAQKHVPDMYYVNKFAEDLRSRRPEDFRRLFG